MNKKKIIILLVLILIVLILLVEILNAIGLFNAMFHSSFVKHITIPIITAKR